MGKRINLTNQRFGKLTVIKEDSLKNGKVYWLCSCDCGGSNVVQTANLRNGMVKSCGCLLHGQYNKKHGQSNNRIYHIWTNMKRRCKTNNKYYGAKGIKVCDEWLNNFKSFYDWSISNGYADNLSIDRKDGNKNYEPSNCRWVTNQEQSNNIKTNRRFLINNEVLTIAQISRKYNISFSTIYKRISLGWEIKDIIKPIDVSKRNRRAKVIV